MTSTSVGRSYLTRREAADLLRLHHATLARWASEGVGPNYVKIGNGHTLYERAELMRFLTENTVSGHQ